ncbi:MAG: YHS domain-containing protein [Aestuariibacter sp.]|nr:YHS domain-containing protein [Aestuariibacter sp.]
MCLALVLSFTAVEAIALDEINTPWYSNVAIEGHDPVGYFLQNAAVKGSKAHKLKWNGVEWHFYSADNKALFESDPEKYAPQYGGYCAWAASQNQVAGVDPEQFSLIDGKLYLNYDEEVKNRWMLNTTKNIADADKNWPGLLANE